MIKNVFGVLKRTHRALEKRSHEILNAFWLPVSAVLSEHHQFNVLLQAPTRSGHPDIYRVTITTALHHPLSDYHILFSNVGCQYSVSHPIPVQLLSRSQFSSELKIWWREPLLLLRFHLTVKNNVFIVT
ncbi:hypothetical protein CDAR_430141 [Caerostris darwini]|uniref:Uncharacterized protein n=1 Tax=Caerostris darwini TaxID=1538125 RepID=A0AAV4WHE9_9ARAC|nr:hypothetical protein CDAR_430141 [Caerostris darwini]